MIIEEKLGKDLQLSHLYSNEARKIKNITNNKIYSEVYTVATDLSKYVEIDELIDDNEFIEKVSLAEKIITLENQYKETKQINEMLTECILEMSDIIYS